MEPERNQQDRSPEKKAVSSPSCQEAANVIYTQIYSTPTYHKEPLCGNTILCGNFNNNSNAEDATTGESSPQGDPPRKKLRAAAAMSQKGNIEATLEGKTLWDEFCRRGTEMIVNRAGRRMFPGFSVAVNSLKPKVKYSMKLEVVLADNHRFKFLNSRWLAVGSAEPQPLSESYLHPDSPNSGAFWMRHGVSFRKLKITNNKEHPGNNALLYSMHKYFLRLVVEEEHKILPGEGKSAPRIVLQADFPETTFVAVTAYQNEEVTQLKITNNPFAKAFRENTADMDWETAQMFYSSQTTFSPLPGPQHPSDHFLIPNSCWHPLVPATPLTTLPQFLPAGSMGCLPPPISQFPYTSPMQTASSPNYFQWPPLPTSQDSENVCYKMMGSSGANLPDFDTVFTTFSD